MQLEAAELAHEPLAGAVLLAAHAHEEVREVEPGQTVLRVAEMHHLAVTIAAAVFRWFVPGAAGSSQEDRRLPRGAACH